MELVSKLAVSGRLKPEARLGLAISEFAKVLDSEHRKEFRSMQAMKSAQISGRDVIKVTEEINQEGARRHSKPKSSPFAALRLFRLGEFQSTKRWAPQ